MQQEPTLGTRISQLRYRYKKAYGLSNDDELFRTRPFEQIKLIGKALKAIKDLDKEGILDEEIKDRLVKLITQEAG